MYWGWGGGYYRRLFCVSRKSVQSVQYVTHIFQFSCEQFFSELVADITEFGNAVNIKVADSEGEEAEHSGSRSRSSGKNMTPLLNIDVEITGEKRKQQQTVFRFREQASSSLASALCTDQKNQNRH